MEKNIKLYQCITLFMAELMPQWVLQLRKKFKKAHTLCLDIISESVIISGTTPKSLYANNSPVLP